MRKIIFTISICSILTSPALGNNCCDACIEWRKANYPNETISWLNTHTSCEAITQYNGFTGTVEGCVPSFSIDLGNGVTQNINTTTSLNGGSNTVCEFNTTYNRVIAYTTLNSITYDCPTNSTCDENGFACNKGYYKSGTNCTKCPQTKYATTAYTSGTTNSANDDEITDCFIYSGHTWHDTTGTFSLDSTCYYSTTASEPCVCGTDTNYDCDTYCP